MSQLDDTVPSFSSRIAGSYLVELFSPLQQGLKVSEKLPGAENTKGAPGDVQVLHQGLKDPTKAQLGRNFAAFDVFEGLEYALDEKATDTINQNPNLLSVGVFVIVGIEMTIYVLLEQALADVGTELRHTFPRLECQKGEQG